MNTRPTGTLFFRSGASNGYGAAQRRLLALYGLLQLPAGLEGERMYPTTMYRAGGGLQLQLNAELSAPVRDHDGVAYTDNESLAGLARRGIWNSTEFGPSVFFTLLRKSGLKPLVAGTELYLAVAVTVANLSELFPEEVLVDFVDGVALNEGQACDSVGDAPDGVLRRPFFLTPEGDRRTLRHTTGPRYTRAMIDISRITLVPPADRSPADQQRLAVLAGDWELADTIKTHEGTGRYDSSDFAAFKRALGANLLPDDRLITADELAQHEAEVTTVVGRLFAESRASELSRLAAAVGA